MSGETAQKLKQKQKQASLQKRAAELEELVRERTAIITLLHDVASAANRAGNAEEILAFVLKRVSAHDDWCFGHAYIISENTPELLVLARSYYEDAPGRFERFRTAVTGQRIKRGDEGLVSRVFSKGRPEWVSDVPGELSGERARLARELGLVKAFAVPVLIENEVVCVLEFFGDESARSGERALETKAVVAIATLVAAVFERQYVHRQMARAAVREHRRIGQALHDTVSQQLTGLEMLAKNLAQKADFERERFDRLLSGLHETRLQVRALAKGLVPVEVDAHGLRHALLDLADSIDDAYPPSCRVTAGSDVTVEDDFAATQLYHIAKEAVHNAARHGAPSSIEITLELNDGWISLRIADDGHGLRRDEAATPRKGGLGMQIMRHRANLIDGVLEVASNGGVTITCWAPLKRASLPGGDEDVGQPQASV